MKYHANVKSNISGINGFTLMEFIIVIIILGVMAVGIGGFITLSTQTYVNVTERDELISNARFAVERLNRELRNAVPNSVRVKVDSSILPNKQCIEFVPIIASTVYTELPTVPEPKSNEVLVIPFLKESGSDYVCNHCGDKMVVYPLTSSDINSKHDIYVNHDDDLSKVFTIEQYNKSALLNQTASLILDAGNVNFAEESPTNRAFIFNQAVSYCVYDNQMVRYAGYDFSEVQKIPPYITTGTYSLMAENIIFDSSALPFSVLEASLQRTAVVQVVLNFTRDSEQVIFNNAIHVSNVP
jgi:MSHA biogenesis protein MshO